MDKKLEQFSDGFDQWHHTTLQIDGNMDKKL